MFTGLKELHLRNNNIRELSSDVVNKMTGLKELHLYDNEIRGLLLCMFTRLILCSKTYTAI